MPRMIGGDIGPSYYSPQDYWDLLPETAKIKYRNTIIDYLSKLRYTFTMDDVDQIARTAINMSPEGLIQNDEIKLATQEYLGPAPKPTGSFGGVVGGKPDVTPTEGAVSRQAPPEYTGPQVNWPLPPKEYPTEPIHKFPPEWIGAPITGVTPGGTPMVPAPPEFAGPQVNWPLPPKEYPTEPIHKFPPEWTGAPVTGVTPGGTPMVPAGTQTIPPEYAGPQVSWPLPEYTPEGTPAVPLTPFVPYATIPEGWAETYGIPPPIEERKTQTWIDPRYEEILRLIGTMGYRPVSIADPEFQEIVSRLTPGWTLADAQITIYDVLGTPPATPTGSKPLGELPVTPTPAPIPPPAEVPYPPPSPRPPITPPGDIGPPGYDPITGAPIPPAGVPYPSPFEGGGETPEHRYLINLLQQAGIWNQIAAENRDRVISGFNNWLTQKGYPISAIPGPDELRNLWGQFWTETNQAYGGGIPPMPGPGQGPPSPVPPITPTPPEGIGPPGYDPITGAPIPPAPTPRDRYPSPFEEPPPGSLAWIKEYITKLLTGEIDLVNEGAIRASGEQEIADWQREQGEWAAEIAKRAGMYGSGPWKDMVLDIASEAGKRKVDLEAEIARLQTQSRQTMIQSALEAAIGYGRLGIAEEQLGIAEGQLRLAWAQFNAAVEAGNDAEAQKWWEIIVRGLPVAGGILGGIWDWLFGEEE